MPRPSLAGLAAGVVLLAAGPLRADLPLLKLRHDGPVHAVAFSPDGKDLITVADRSVRIWDATSGALRRRFQVVDGQAIAFSPDGKIIAIGGSGPQVHLYDLTTGKEDGALNLLGGKASFVGISDRGTIAVYATHLIFFDLASRQQRQVMGLGWSDPGACAMTRDGRLIALSVGGGLYLFELNGFLRPRSSGGPRNVTAVTFAPDNQTLAAACADHSLRLIKNNRELRRLATLPGPASCLCYAPKGKRLAVGGSEGTVSLIDTDGPKRRRFHGHRASVSALAFSPDGRSLASASADGTVRVWDTTAAAAPHISFSSFDLPTLWPALTNSDAATARRAFAAFTAAPGAVPFLKEKIAAVAHLEIADHLRQLIGALDDDSFAVRRKASADLKALGAQAEPALRIALATTDSEEVRQRAEQLLGDHRTAKLTDEQRRALEAIELLVEIGGPTARQALADLSRQSLSVPFPTEVRQALARFDQAPPRQP